MYVIVVKVILTCFLIMHLAVSFCVFFFLNFSILQVELIESCFCFFIILLQTASITECNYSGTEIICKYTYMIKWMYPILLNGSAKWTYLNRFPLHILYIWYYFRLWFIGFGLNFVQIQMDYSLVVHSEWILWYHSLIVHNQEWCYSILKFLQIFWIFAKSRMTFESINDNHVKFTRSLTKFSNLTLMYIKLWCV